MDLGLRDMGSKEQQRRAIVLLVKAIFDQLHEVNSLRKAGHPAALSILLLREMCSILPDLDEELRAYYYSVLPELVGKGTISRPPISEDYAEQTQQAKENFLSRIRQQLAA